MSTNSEIRGYMTTSTHLAATRRRPCPTHFQPDWHGKGLWDESCPACQATPPEVEDLGIVDWESNDPRVIDVTPEGAVLEPNPFRRIVHKLRSHQ